MCLVSLLVHTPLGTRCSRSCFRLELLLVFEFARGSLAFDRYQDLPGYVKGFAVGFRQDFTESALALRVYACL